MVKDYFTTFKKRPNMAIPEQNNKSRHPCKEMEKQTVLLKLRQTLVDFRFLIKLSFKNTLLKI